MQATPLAELDWFTGDETVDRLLDHVPRPLRRLIATRPRNPIRLQTPRLTLRELTVGDLDACVRLLDDRGHRRHVLPHQFGREYALRAVGGALVGPHRPVRLHYTLAIELRDGGRFAGTCTLGVRGRFRRRAFIGWEIARACSGTGIAAEAGHALIGLVGDSLGVRRIGLDCDERNERCMAVARKLGLHRVALRPWTRRAMQLRYGADLPYARFVATIES